MSEILAHTLKKIALALFYILIYFAVLYMLTVHVDLLEEDVENYSGIITILASMTALSIYAVTFFFRGKRITDAIIINRVRFFEVALTFTMAIGFRLLTGAYLMWSERNIPILQESIRNAHESYNFNTMTTFCMISIILSVCIVAPLFEEILFRGIVFGELGETMPVWAAVLLQAFLFGIAHAVLAQSIFAAVYGVILGVIYYRTKNLSLAITAHIFFNISSVLEIKNIDMLGKMTVTGMILTMVSIFIFFYIYKREAPSEQGELTGGNNNV